jgi:hypothetical protein
MRNPSQLIPSGAQPAVVMPEYVLPVVRELPPSVTTNQRRGLR